MLHSPVLLVAASLLTAEPQQSFQTDTTIAVPQGTRLRIHDQGGDVVVKTWDKNQLRVQATHSTRTSVDIQVGGAVVEIQGRARRGPSNLVDYQITAPVWMALDLGGMYAEVSVEGTRGAVKAQTLEGNITVRGPAESVTLTTVNGKIIVDGARGRMDLHSVSDDIEVSNAQGDVTAETVSGSIELRGVDGKSIEAQSVSGDLVFLGRIVDGGSYSFLSHSGEVTLGIPEGTNATISLASAMGDFSSSFPLTSERSGPRHRRTYRLGSGSATVEAETFSGEISLMRPAEVSGPRARRHEDKDDEDRGWRMRNKIKVRPRPDPDRDRGDQADDDDR